MKRTAGWLIIIVLFLLLANVAATVEFGGEPSYDPARLAREQAALQNELYWGPIWAAVWNLAVCPSCGASLRRPARRAWARSTKRSGPAPAGRPSPIASPTPHTPIAIIEQLGSGDQELLSRLLSRSLA
jgi:hypothetical protein